jgi:hypothetical protein
MASMLQTIIRQRSRITNIAEGDANTRYFHLQACHINRKSHIDKVNFGGAVLIQEEKKAEAFFRHLDDLLGTSSPRSLKLDLEEIGMPKLDPQGLDFCFSEE